MNTYDKTILGWLAALLLAFGSVSSRAQVAPSTTSPTATTSSNTDQANDEKALKMEKLVVTGVFEGVSRHQATTAVSVVDSTEIDRLQTVNALDLLSNVPGVFVDTSNGIVTSNYQPSANAGVGAFTTTGAKVSSRGLGFIVVEEDGLPVEGAVNMGSDILLRSDETLDRIEVVRGGSAAVTAANAPGGIFNYISKIGGDVLTGDLSVSYGLQGDGSLPYERVDIDVGGPLAANGWYFNAGGFYQHDFGTRESGFPMDFGGEFKANVVKKFAKATVELYVKYLDDHNQYSNLVPAVDWGSPTPAAGWSNTSSSSYYPVSFPVQIAPNTYKQFNSANLVNPKSASVGLKFSAEPANGWTINNNLKFSSNRLINDGSGGSIYQLPLTSGTIPFFYTYGTSASGLPGTFTFTDRANGSYATVVSDNSGNETILNNSLPNTQAEPNSVLFQGAVNYTVGENEWEDQFSVSKKFDRMSFTLGGYFDHSNTEAILYGSSYGFSTLTPKPTMLDVTLQTQGGQTLQLTSPEGFGVPLFNSFGRSTWDQRAAFFGHTWKILTDLTLDWGIRYENVSVKATQLAGASTITTSNSNNIWADAYTEFGDSLTNYRSIGTLTYTGALNFEINKSNAVYLRYSLGKVTPGTAFYEGLGPGSAVTAPTIPQVVTQWELGYKFEQPRYSVNITPYYSLLSAPSTTTLTGNASSSFLGEYLDYTPANQTRDYGVEVDGHFYFDHGFALRVSATWQNATALSNYQWTQPNGPAPLGSPNDVLVNINPGYRAENIPNFMAMITPSYVYGNFLVQIQEQYLGDREANNADAFVLPAFEQTNLTIQWKLTKHLRLSFTENNVFNSGGVMQWNAPGGFGANNEALTRAQVAQDPNAVFSILQIPARAYFVKCTYSF